MIVELPTTPDESTPPRTLWYFFFPNNNLAVRAKCAAELGGYDETLTASEDVDICIRLSQNSDWIACREATASVRHHPRSDFASFVRQMWWWGWELGRVYRKTGNRGLFLYLVPRPKQIHALELPASERFPLLVALFLTDFHFAHLSVLLAIVSAFYWSPLIFFGALGSATYFISRYLKDCVSLPLEKSQRLKVGGYHYVANLVLSTAAFLGGLRSGVLLIPASIFRPR